MHNAVPECRGTGDSFLWPSFYRQQCSGLGHLQVRDNANFLTDFGQETEVIFSETHVGYDRSTGNDSIDPESETHGIRRKRSCPLTETFVGYETARKKSWDTRSVPDPDPSPYDPEDPYVFGPPGINSGSVIYLYGSGSRTFHQEAKKFKTLDIYCFVTFYLWRIMKMYLQQGMSIMRIFLASWRSLTKRVGLGSGAGSISQRYGSASGSVPKCHGSGTLDHVIKAQRCEETGKQTISNQKERFIFLRKGLKIQIYLQGYKRTVHFKLRLGSYVPERRKG